MPSPRWGGSWRVTMGSAPMWWSDVRHWCWRTSATIRGSRAIRSSTSSASAPIWGTAHRLHGDGAGHRVCRRHGTAAVGEAGPGDDQVDGGRAGGPARTARREIGDRSYSCRMGRTSDAGEKILAAGRSLFEARGYSALGVAEICKAAGVPKGSFYYFYASKEALALAVVDEHWADQRREWTRILAGGGDGAQPLDRLRQLFEETEAGQHAAQQGRGTVPGCLFGNLSLEMSNQTEAVRARGCRRSSTPRSRWSPRSSTRRVSAGRSASTTPGRRRVRSSRSWRARCCSRSCTTTPAA